MLPDFNRLKVFYYVFLEKSVAGAARELNITPSAVSQALHKLESELTVLLFTRLHKKLVPTSAGEQLFDILTPFIQNLKSGIKYIRRAKQIPSGMINVGAPIEFGKSYLPGVFAKFRKKYPEVVFTLKLGGPAEIFPMVKSGGIDFGLADIFLTRDQVFENLVIYSIEPLIDEEVILACSKRYYDSEIDGDHSFKNMVSKEYISYTKSSFTLMTWFKYHFNKHPAKLNRVLTADSLQAVITGIKNDLGLGVVVAHIVGEEIKSGQIVPIKTAKKNVINKIALVQLQDKIPSLTEKTFVNFLETDIISSGSSKKFLTVFQVE